MEPRLAAVQRDIIVSDQMLSDHSVFVYGHCRHPRIVLPQKRWLRRALWLFVLAFPVIGRCTSIALLMQDRSITVAADSYQYDGGVKNLFCKIRLINGFLFVVSGLYADTNSGFSTLDLVASATSRSGTVATAIQSLKILVNSRLPAVIQGAKNKVPASYAEWQRGLNVVSIGLGRIEGGSATFMHCEFRINALGNVIAPTCETVDKQPSNGATWIGMGTSETTKYVIVQNREASGTAMLRDPIRFVNSAVELEMAAHRLQNKDDVGPPISTATFDSSGLLFKDRGVCPADQPNKK
jgi:hypothetical protein